MTSKVNSIALKDVIVATVMPFHPDGAIDWDSYARLLDYCATPDGISAVFVNGHAGEGAALTNDERLQVIEFTRRHIGNARTLLAGIIALFPTGDAVKQAKEAVSAGAEVVVFVPAARIRRRRTLTPDAPIAWVEALARAAGAPVSVFQYPLSSGCGYSTETLVEIAKIPGVIAIKEGSDTITAYEDNWRKVKAANSKIAILPSNFDWFLAQLAVGADGILSGLASLAPDLLIEIWREAEQCDLAAMRRVNDRLIRSYVASTAGPPHGHAHPNQGRVAPFGRDRLCHAAPALVAGETGDRGRCRTCRRCRRNSSPISTIRPSPRSSSGQESQVTGQGARRKSRSATRPSSARP